MVAALVVSSVCRSDIGAVGRGNISTMVGGLHNHTAVMSRLDHNTVGWLNVCAVMGGLDVCTVMGGLDVCTVDWLNDCAVRSGLDVCTVDWLDVGTMCGLLVGVSV